MGVDGLMSGSAPVRCIRGGCYAESARAARSSARTQNMPDTIWDMVGLLAQRAHFGS